MKNKPLFVLLCIVVFVAGATFGADLPYWAGLPVAILAASIMMIFGGVNEPKR